jgi:hypothetical protein
MIKPNIKPAADLPPENVPKRRCRCGDCRNSIPAMTLCHRVGGRNVCESCARNYRRNPASQKWEIYVEPKPRMGRPPLGDSACEVRWFAKATHDEEALLQRLANEHTRGNKSELLRLAVRRMADINL